MSDPAAVERCYDQLAQEYARRSSQELQNKPSDRKCLEEFASLVQGPICDLGCGPGQVSAYLHTLGKSVVGVDLSEVMLAQARRLHPDIVFVQADMRKLPLVDQAWGGLVGFYCVCHLSRRELNLIWREFRRVLRCEGRLLLAFHVGWGTFRKEQAWNHDISLATTLFSTQELCASLQRSGFAVEWWFERAAYQYWEQPGWRGYLRARKTEGLPAVSEKPGSLVEAVYAGTLEEAQEWLAAGNHPDEIGNQGMNPLFAASVEGRLEMVELLLEKGARAHLELSEGGWPLHAATYFGHLDVARRLVAAGADPNLPDGSGNTPLHGASAGNQSQVVGWLLSLGVDATVRNQLGETAYQSALRFGSQRVVEQLRAVS